MQPYLSFFHHNRSLNLKSGSVAPRCENAPGWLNFPGRRPHSKPCRRTKNPISQRAAILIKRRRHPYFSQAQSMMRKWWKMARAAAAAQGRIHSPALSRKIAKQPCVNRLRERKAGRSGARHVLIGAVARPIQTKAAAEEQSVLLFRQRPQIKAAWSNHSAGKIQPLQETCLHAPRLNRPQMKLSSLSVEIESCHQYAFVQNNGFLLLGYSVKHWFYSFSDQN